LPTSSKRSSLLLGTERVWWLEVQGQIGPFRARISYLLEPAGTETRLRNAVVLGSSGPLTLVAPLVTSRVKHAVAANLDTLKQLLS
jgi:hypothetical protein